MKAILEVAGLVVSLCGSFIFGARFGKAQALNGQYRVSWYKGERSSVDQEPDRVVYFQAKDEENTIVGMEEVVEIKRLP